jgi:hypothetical protein
MPNKKLFFYNESKTFFYNEFKTFFIMSLMSLFFIDLSYEICLILGKYFTFK